jgi:hypothetical protein
MNPYIQSFQQPQDMSGLQPVYQNMAAQQQFQNQAAQQGQQLTQQAGQTTGGNGMNPMALAAALRKPNDPYAANKGDPYANAQTAINKYGADNVYGYGGQGQVPVWNGEM